MRSPEVDHLVKVVDAEQEHGGLVEGAHGVDAVPEPVLDHIRQLADEVQFSESSDEKPNVTLDLGLN